MDFEQTKLLLAENNTLNNQVENLIYYSLKEKKLQYSESDDIDVDYLQVNNIIEKRGTLYKIINNKIIAYKIFQLFKEWNEFEISDNFQATYDFILSLRERFSTDLNFSGYINLQKMLYSVAIYESNINYNANLSVFISSFEKKDKSSDNYFFIEAYSKTLPFLTSSVEEIFLNSKLFLDYTNENVEFNIPANNVLIGLQTWCEKNTSQGYNLFVYATKQEIDIAVENIISCLTVVLYTEQYDTLIKPLLYNNIFAKEILNGLSRLKEVGTLEIDEFIRVFEYFEVSSLLHPQLIYLLVSCFNYENISNKQVEIIFSKLNDLLQNTEPPNKNIIINAISHIKDNESRKKTLLINFITQPDFSYDEHIHLIANCFYNIKSGHILKSILLSLVNANPFKDIAKHFESPLSTFDAIELDKVIIELVTNDKASIRHGGLNIFNQLSLHNSHVFSCDILRLPPLNQYKLWVGLTQNIKEPKYIIPSIVPLLNSQSDIVKESVICKLEEYTEDYGGQVISTLEAHLKGDEAYDLLIIERVKKYMKYYYNKYIEIKYDIKELNPYYSHNKLFNSYNKIFRRDFSKKLNKEVDENSFMRLFGKSIKLAKGGGWKVGDKISKLGSIESSMSLPRSYYIFPTKYEFEESKRMQADWGHDDFVEIEKCIANEQ